MIIVQLSHDTSMLYKAFKENLKCLSQNKVSPTKTSNARGIIELFILQILFLVLYFKKSIDRGFDKIVKIFF